MAGEAAVLVENTRLFQAAENGRRRLEAILTSTNDAVIVVGPDSARLVVDVKGRLVRVRMKPASDCGSCCACSALGGKDREFEIESDLPVQVGDKKTTRQGRLLPTAWLPSYTAPLWPPIGMQRDDGTSAVKA